MLRHLMTLSIVEIALSLNGFTQTFNNINLTDNSSDQSEPWIVHNSRNPNEIFVGWNDFRDALTRPGWALSTNSGTSWNTGLLNNGFDPSFAFNSNGDIFYLHEMTNGTIRMAKTTNQGSEWTYKIISTVADNDKPFMALDNSGQMNDGHIYTTWMNGSSGTSVKFSYSSDNGENYSNPISIAVPDTIISTWRLVAGSVPIVAPNGDLYVMWGQYYIVGTINDRYNRSKIKIRKITHGGDSLLSISTIAPFTYNVADVGTLHFFMFPSIAIDPNGHLHVVYYDQLSLTDASKRIKYARSTDGGTNWSSPSIIGDMGGGWQFFPAIHADTTGRITVTFMHTSNSAQTVDCYITQSVDGGLSFLSPTRVTNTSSDPSDGVEHHEYMGITSIPNTQYAVWTDYRNQNPDIYFTTLKTSQISNSNSATAFGTTPKTLYSDSTNLWNTIYLDAGKIHHTLSPNDGFTWYIDTIISASVGGITSSSNPALVEAPNGTLHVVFASTGNGIYHTRKSINGSWSTPTKIYNASDVRYPSLIINHDTGHVVFVSYLSGGDITESPSGAYKVYYGTFDVDISDDLSIKKEVYSSPVTSVAGVSLAQTSNGQLHTVWARGNEIYHSSGTGTNWSVASNISNNNGVSTNPSIAAIPGNIVRVVWQDNTPGNNDILSKQYSGSWSNVENLSDNNGSSVNPMIINSSWYGGVPVVSWSDNSNGNYNIWYQIYGLGSVELRSTPQISNHPAITEHTFNDTTRFLFVWTEGSNSPYTIATAYSDAPDLGGKTVFRELVRERDLNFKFELSLNYPNPFNPTTTIRYSIPEDNWVMLTIYNTLGQAVAIVVNDFISAGTHQVEFNGGKYPSGVYLYRLNAGNYSASKKLVLIK